MSFSITAGTEGACKVCVKTLFALGKTEQGFLL